MSILHSRFIVAALLASIAVAATPTVHAAAPAAAAKAVAKATAPGAKAARPVEFLVRDRDLKNAPEWFPLPAEFGVFDGGVQWMDKNGENVVILSSRHGEGMRERFATHVIKIARPHQWQQDTWIVQQWREHIDICPEDTVLAMKMAGIFDEDRDGVGEAVFTVERACISDVSPIDYAMHVWEGGSDYALTGQTAFCVEDRGDEVPSLGPDGLPICKNVKGGKVEFSPFFDQASEPVRKNARALWAERIPVAGAFAVSKEARLHILNTMFEPAR